VAVSGGEGPDLSASDPVPATVAYMCSRSNHLYHEMRTVTVSAGLDVSPESVFDQLSPESIIGYKRVYDVEEVASRADGWLVTATSTEMDTRAEFAVEELEDGYSYRLVDDEPFAELFTTVRVAAHDPASDDDADPAPVDEVGRTRVTLTSEFTFGGSLAPLLDRLALRHRRDELERTLASLKQALGSSPCDAETAEGGS